ncbi:type I restriction enzyme S subunit [Mycobacterium frederiksbergense]|uniref:Type I restriction enzyme S subunit n=1 Tax=Mycolicibacterium frederiksbergense TaxID=117567 RepID=A0ABT6KWU8_9MYCO|nr:restriction endonuclease subunit S [Mycolicibacterium frederiksbergense]MDH6194440.1 type I restriction enzyme S subunit [Mycolicibacterium frederiksbergense]
MKTVALGDVARFVRGVTFKPSDVLDGPTATSVGVMRTKNVQDELEVNDILQIPRDLVRQVDQYLHVGDILISSANSWNLVGRCSWVPELAAPAAIGGFVTGLRVTSADVDPRFLYRWFSSPHTQAEVRNCANQTTNIANLNLRRCELLRLPLPPLDEQRRIAAILDHADTLRAKRREVGCRVDDLTKAIYLGMFGSTSTRFATVNEIALPVKGAIRTGPFGSQLLHSEFVDEGVAVLGLDNVVGNAFTWGERRYISPAKYEALRRYTVEPGDVLISIMGTCGRCVVVPADIGTAINTKHICAITLDPDIALPEFVRATFLWHPRSRHHLTQRTKGSIMDGLNMGIVKEMPVPLPRLELQQEFVARANSVTLLGESAVTSATDLDELFASLQSRAFRGEL